MKKVAFVVVLVAVIVGIVLGGLSVASGYGPLGHTPGPSHTPWPTCTPKPTPTPDCCQVVNGKVTNIQDNVSTIFTNVDSILNEFTGLTKMDVLSGNLTADNDENNIGQS